MKLRSLLFASMLAVSCGGGDLSLSDFLTQATDASCKADFRCCSSAELMTLFMGESVNNQPVTTESQCEQFQNGFVFFGVAIIQQSIDSGRLVFDGGAASTCIDAVNGLACSEISGSTITSPNAASCADVLVPQQGVGDPCSQSIECTTNNCVGAMMGSNGNTDGACQEFPALGSACVGECGSGQFCGFDGSNETCQPKKDAGSGCEEDSECTSDHCLGSDGALTCEEICTGN